MRTAVRKVLATLGVGAVVASSFVALGATVAATPAYAIPGQPGVTSPGTVLYQEDFQNVPGPSPIQRITEYVGPGGETYTADQPWLENCNGWVAAWAQAVAPAPQVADCNGDSGGAGQIGWNGVQQQAWALGVYNGQSAAAAQNNFAVSAYTQANPGAGFVEFETVENIPFSGVNRFLTFSVDVAASNCFAAHPLLQFQLLNDAGTATNLGTPLDGCLSTDTVAAPALGAQGPRTINVGTFTSNGAVLFTGSSVGIRMINNQGSGAGNDHTFDNIRILDVTPQLDKEFVPAIAKTGETSTLTFTITNTDELGAKNGWSFTDALPAGLTIADPSAVTTDCSATVIDAPVGGNSISATGNLDAGKASCVITVDVTSDVPGTFTNGPDNVTQTGLNPPGETTVDFQDPSLTILKEAGTPTDVNGNGITDAGDTIVYSFLVTNTGDVALTGVVVNDPKVGAVDCPATSLAVGADMTCDATYTVTADDVAGGSVDNTATATGTPPVGPPVTSPPSDTTTPVVAPAPALSLVKSVDDDEIDVAGETVTYSFAVTNSGNVPLQGVSINEVSFNGDGDLSDIVCPAGPLAVGDTTTCTATYTITQTDFDRGSVSNSATASGTPVGGTDPVISNESSANIIMFQDSALELTKSATPSDPDSYEEGQLITYSFVVRNAGDTTLTNVAVDELSFSGTGTMSDIVCGPDAATLAPGAFVICTATYTLTQADIDAEQVTNEAAASAQTPSGNSVVSEPDDAIVPVIPAPELTLVKSVTPETVAAVGETVTYSFLLTNTGNVTLTDATVDEGDFSGTGDLSDVICPAEAASLIPGGSVTCEATYVLTQADIDAGEVTNTATGTATPPSGDPISSEPDDAVVTAEQTPGIAVVKTATPDTANAAGDTITYSFLVTNTGNVTLDDIVIDEGAFSGTGELSDIVCPAGPLAPTVQVTCEATYVLTQADVDAGTVTNSATAQGTPPSGEPVESDPSDETVTIPPAGSLAIVKSSDTTEITAAGQTITYSFAVTNTGNVTVSDVVVNEVAFTGTGELSPVVCETTTVAPGDTITCEATYVVTQADVDAGSITNAATAGGEDPTDTPVPETPPSEVEIPVTQTPGITIVKSGAITGDEYVVGAEVVYSFVATNTGNTTLTDVVINEVSFSGTGELSEIVCPADGVASLAPGAQVTCEATYALTQADIDAGQVTNAATATGTPPGDSTPITSTPDDALIPTPQEPALSIVKTANVQQITTVGQEIVFSFVITNTGNVTVTNPEVVEGEFSGTGELSAIDCPADAVLVPGQQVTCTATYTVTQADLDAGQLTNTATAIGETPTGTPTDPSDPSTVEVPTDPQPALTVVKTADKDSVVGVGQIITYTFTITNTGNVTINDAHVVETDFTGAGELSAITCEAGAASLAPGTSVDCTATYRTTQADVTAGGVTNTAVSSGTPVTGGDPVPSEPSTVTVDVTPGPSLAITGGEIATGVVALAILLLIGGGALMLIRRRRDEVTAD